MTNPASSVSYYRLESKSTCSCGETKSTIVKARSRPHGAWVYCSTDDCGDILWAPIPTEIDWDIDGTLVTKQGDSL